MNFIGYEYKVKVELSITDKDLETLLELSSRHYDGHCQSVSKQGGFLYGWNNQFHIFEKQSPIKVTVSTYELDTLVKITEMADTNEAAGLHFELKRMLIAAGHEYEKINKVEKKCTTPAQ